MKGDWSSTCACEDSTSQCRSSRARSDRSSTKDDLADRRIPTTNWRPPLLQGLLLFAGSLGGLFALPASPPVVLGLTVGGVYGSILLGSSLILDLQQVYRASDCPLTLSRYLRNVFVDVRRSLGSRTPLGSSRLELYLC